MACLVRWARQGAKAAAASCLSLALAASASAQLPVTDGLLLWLDASDPATLFQDTAMTIPSLNGDPIGGWADKSGNGFDATAVGDDNRPVRNDSALNDRPAARFAAADADGMLVDPALSLARPYTVFIVNQYWGDTKGRTLQGADANWLHGLWAGNVASFADGWISANQGAPKGLSYVSDTTGTPGGDSTFYAAFGPNTEVQDLTDSSAPVGNPGGLALVGAGAFPAELSDADISEVVVYDRVLSGAELTQVRNSLYAKYDVFNDVPIPPEPQNVALRGTLGTFNGADAGEGLDLAGTFAHAINVGGAEIAVGGLTFTDGSEAGMAGGSSPGATITDANEAPGWNPGDDYGDSAADDALEAVMLDIRWNTPPGLDIDLTVDPGQLYKLQLLFSEQCCDRGWDISVEGELSIDNLNLPEMQGGIGVPDQGVVFTQIVSSDDDVLSIMMGGNNPEVGDRNPILQGLTLEVVPEPSTWVLLGLGSLAFLAVIRRRN